MIRRKFLALVAVMSCSFTFGAHAQTEVAFVGGFLTDAWEQTSQFTANSNWIGDGIQPSGPIGPCHETGPALIKVNQIIASGQKPTIHLLVGQADADGASDSNPPAFEMTSFENCFEQLVKTVQNAKLKLIVGTEPFAFTTDIRPYDEFMYAYCAAHNIPVVDYLTALKGWEAYGNANEPISGYWTYPPSAELPTLTPAGYTLITQLAQSAIAQAFNGVTLNAGYLGNEAPLNVVGGVFGPNVNTVPLDTLVQWYAYGEYSDGVTRQLGNANINGSIGTWTSTNPSVMKVEPDGTSWAIGVGTTSIKFTTLSGVTLNEWNMTVGAECPQEGPCVVPAP